VRDGGAMPILPRRTSSVRRVGRHRSMHRISVASDAPALVLAIPGAGNDHDSELADQIAEAAAESCPGVEIRIGYLASETDSLRDALTTEPTKAGPAKDGAAAPRSVIVPLLAGSHPTIDRHLEAVVNRLKATTMLAPHLGPHPLLAGALHDRLSEVGLARASRARGLNISAGANGVLVIADRGPQAVNDAGVTAVLLAARLAVPVLPASLGDSVSITAALERLREAGATHPAIAPCLIGPETDPSELTQLSNAIDAPCAAPLGAHPAIAQLVAIRYGEALARISVASR
jgi:sirohydrochlorin ferrochelatase